MSNKKNIIIIANLYHASPRIPGITKYLSQYGWEVTIITPLLKDMNSHILPNIILDKVNIVETEYYGDIWQFWRKALTIFNFKVNKSGYQSGLVSQIKDKFAIRKKRSFIELLMNIYRLIIFAFPDDEKTWKKTAINDSCKIMNLKRFDIILSSSPHPTSHLVACELKKRFGVPWIADFRDPWSQNHDYPYGKIRKWIDTIIEKRVMSNVDLIIAATPEYAKKQATLHRKETLVLTNGFESDFEANSTISSMTPDKKKFLIVYTGKIYQDKQDPCKIFSVLRKLVNEGKINPEEVELDFFGPPNQFLNELINRYGLGSIVKERGVITRENSYIKQRQAQLLLLLNWEDYDEKGVYPTKLFEYLSSGRPILATGGYNGDDVQMIISKTKSGIYAVTENEIEKVLLEFWSEFKKKGIISYNGNLKEINNYSYQKLAEQLSEIIAKVIQ